jgi:acetyl-CoA C-acetyltransferase
MTQPEAFVVETARTAIGTFGGWLKDVAPTRLGATAVRAALQSFGGASDAVGHVVMGNVIRTEPTDGYLSRVPAMDAGIFTETPTFKVNRLCGSGLQAII